MQKRVISFSLVFALLWAMAACAAPAPGPVTQTTAPETTVPVTTVPETTVPQTTAHIIIEADFFLPLPDQVGNAVLAEQFMDENQIIHSVYKNAGPEDLSQYLFDCAACGLYAKEAQLADGSTGYTLHPIGIAYEASVSWNPEDGTLTVTAAQTDGLLNQAALDVYMEYYRQEIVFPEELGTDLLPLFPLSVGTRAAQSHTGKGMAHIFNGDSFKKEIYSFIYKDMLRKFLDEMLLCGYTPLLTMAVSDDAGAMQVLFLQLTKGETVLMLSYNATDYRTTLFYHSETAYHFLTMEDYATYIPQRGEE